ncbi:MAG: anti-sigma factor RsiW [Pseudohongiellaceae bacterium]|jgi:anti-sigma factor RsiW
MSDRQDCRSVRGLLMLYLDSELDATATLTVNQHLVACESCRTRFEAEQLLEAAIAAGLQTGEEMPTDVWKRLTTKLADERPPAAESREHDEEESAGPVLANAQPKSAPRSRSSAKGAQGQRSRRWSWPMASALAAAAMVVAALSLWLHDPGVPADGHSRSYLQQLASLHRGSMVPTAGSPLQAAQDLLADMSLPGAFLPAAARQDDIDGHPLKLISAGRVQVLNMPAITLRYDCCGVPTSVYIVARADLLSLPAELLSPALSALAGVHGQGDPDNAVVDDSVDGLLTRSLLTGGVFMSVISEHSVVLADAWSS